MGGNGLSLDVAIEEELFRIYKKLPYVSQEELLQQYPKKLGKKKKFREKRETVKKVADLVAKMVDGKRCVYEITRELRDKGYELTPDIVFRILEEYREMGGIRVQMLKPPGQVLEEKVHTTKPKLEVAKEEIPETAKVAEAKPSKPSKPPKPAEMKKTEAQEVEEGIADMLESLEETPGKTKLSKASEKGRPVLEALLNMNEDIEIATVCSSDGYSVSFASREMVKLDEIRVAASSAVIKSVSDKNLEYMKKGSVDQIILYTKKGFIFLLPISEEYLFTVTASKEAQVATIIRDAKWATKRIKSEILREPPES